jgi:hypothetical protein
MVTEPNAGGELTDDALQDEIELVGELVVAASASERPLTDDEIDRLLGVDRQGGPDHGFERGHRLEHGENTGRHGWRRQEA